jgi:hypothetical protein
VVVAALGVGAKGGAGAGVFVAGGAWGEIGATGGDPFAAGGLLEPAASIVR